jgi:hypothetical protein
MVWANEIQIEKGDSTESREQGGDCFVLFCFLHSSDLGTDYASIRAYRLFFISPWRRTITGRQKISSRRDGNEKSPPVVCSPSVPALSSIFISLVDLLFTEGFFEHHISLCLPLIRPTCFQASEYQLFEVAIG